VYIREAHASNAWQVESNKKDNVIYKEPEHYDERVSLANTCSINLGIEFPALVDTIEDSTEIAYTGWPDRLYLIDANGHVAFKSEAGPFGFKTDQLANAIDGLGK
jgi:type I thyroxine 5'-deiodinase